MFCSDAFHADVEVDMFDGTRHTGCRFERATIAAPAAFDWSWFGFWAHDCDFVDCGFVLATV